MTSINTKAFIVNYSQIKSSIIVKQGTLLT